MTTFNSNTRPSAFFSSSGMRAVFFGLVIIYLTDASAAATAIPQNEGERSEATVVSSDAVAVTELLSSAPRVVSQSSPSSLEAVTSETFGMTSSDPACYSLVSKEDFELDVQPLPKRPAFYDYNTDQVITLECRRKPGTTPDPSSDPYVFIHSCEPCGGYHSYSDAGQGVAELRLQGEEKYRQWGEGQQLRQCQFACWQYNRTCGTLPSLRINFSPPEYECLKRWDFSDFKTVSFEELARPVSHWCVSENWKGLRCTWRLQKGSLIREGDICQVRVACVDSMLSSPTDSAEKNVTLSSTGEGDRDSGHISATVIFEALEVGRSQNCSLTYRIHTTVGDVEKNYSVHTDMSIVQFDPVTSMEVAPVTGNSSVLGLEFTVPSSAVPIDKNGLLECRLRVASESLPWLNITEQAFDLPCQKKGMLVTGLHPSVNYSVFLQIRYILSPFWSQEKGTWGSTPEDVPSAAPEMTIGGHVVQPYGAGDSVVTVYFKDLPPEYKNGKLTRFKLTAFLSDEYDADAESDSRISDSANVRSMSIHLKNGSNSRQICARVSAATRAGFFDARDCLPVAVKQNFEDAESNGHVWVDRVADQGAKRTYVVRWGPEVRTWSNLTVFWCWSYSKGNCTSHMNWAHISSNETIYTVDDRQAPALDRSRDQWQFGLARVRLTASPGVVWSQCTFAEPGAVPLAPAFEVEEGEKQITLRWSIDCNYPYYPYYYYRRPRRFLIYWGTYETSVSIDENHECTAGNNETVEAKIGQNRYSHTIYDLEEDRDYFVCMRGVVGEWKEEERTEWRRVPVKLRKAGVPVWDSRPLTITIIVTVIVVAIVLGACACQLRGWIKKKERKFSDNLDFRLQGEAGKAWSSTSKHLSSAGSAVLAEVISTSAAELDALLTPNKCGDDPELTGQKPEQAELKSSLSDDITASTTEARSTGVHGLPTKDDVGIIKPSFCQNENEEATQPVRESFEDDDSSLSLSNEDGDWEREGKALRVTENVLEGPLRSAVVGEEAEHNLAGDARSDVVSESSESLLGCPRAQVVPGPKSLAGEEDSDIQAAKAPQQTSSIFFAKDPRNTMESEDTEGAEHFPEDLTSDASSDEHDTLTPEEESTSYVPFARALTENESTVPMKDAQESIVLMKDAQESYVPMTDAQESYVPMTDAQESYVPMTDAPESYVQLTDVQNSYVPMKVAQEIIA